MSSFVANKHMDQTYFYLSHERKRDKKYSKKLFVSHLSSRVQPNNNNAMRIRINHVAYANTLLYL